MLFWIALAGAGLFALSKSGMIRPSSTVNNVPITGTGAIFLGPPNPSVVASGPRPQPPTQWPPLAGQPGFVTIGGSPAPPDFSTGNINTAIQASTIGAAAVGATIGAFQGAFLVTGTPVLIGLGAALPIIGAGIAAVGFVLSIIAKHHAAAVAHEAQVLASATPVIRQRQVLIAQAAVHGEINYSQAVQLVSQAIADFYVMTKTIQRGTWKWNPAYNDQSAGFWAKGMNQESPNSHPPDPCNAACWYGHFAVEGDCYTVLLPTIQKILSGQHGMMELPVVPSHAAEAGYPAVDMVF